ncbi:MAG: NAD(P)H-hydrate dehydratase [Treponema sp.]|jgi:NAD(P)H-hydrate epimerase|nr:NAD(P)H-hydrate dehydratase [Treponema sp.]
MKTVTSKQMREIEQIAINELGIPSILLMENAAARVAEHCLKLTDANKNAKVLIVCGLGNNGGDGLAVARLLHVKGVDVNVIYVGDINAAKGDAATYLTIIKNIGIPIINTDFQSIIETCDFVVDAIFGTGLDRNIEGNYRHLIELINSYAKYVISVDIPSGVHSDTGRIMGCAVKANETITFAFPKTGLYLYPGAENAGKIHIQDITIPATLLDRVKPNVNVLTNDEAANLLPVRARRSNKGSFGKVMVFAGSDEMPGAAALACSAAYMVGAGLVCACVLPNVAKVIYQWQREAITRIVPGKNGMYSKKSIESLASEINNSSVIIIGPGIGRSPDVTEFVFELLSITKVPVVLDADALYAISENISLLKTLKAPCIITPHPGEMNRLTSLTVPEILDNTIGIAAKFAKDFNVVTLLKDAHTIIASPCGAVNINITGNNALAKAGTGDVLTGMIAGFIAQGSNVFTAGILGAYYHGKSCEAAMVNKSLYGITASNIIEYIPIVMKS